MNSENKRKPGELDFSSSQESDKKAFAHLMRRGLEKPQSETDQVFQDVYDELDQESTDSELSETDKS